MAVAGILVAALVPGGYANRVVERFNSAVNLVSGQKRAGGHNDDTYNGRLALAKERLGLAAQDNPFVVYGSFMRMMCRVR